MRKREDEKRDQKWPLPKYVYDSCLGENISIMGSCLYHCKNRWCAAVLPKTGKYTDSWTSTAAENPFMDPDTWVVRRVSIPGRQAAGTAYVRGAMAQKAAAEEAYQSMGTAGLQRQRRVPERSRVNWVLEASQSQDFTFSKWHERTVFPLRSTDKLDPVSLINKCWFFY